MKGKFRPKNPDKYKGNPTEIIYRSSWELKFMMYLDSHGDVIEWSSEQVIIPYRSPIDNKIHRYYVDFYVKLKTKDGNIEKRLIEIKPKKQTCPPSKPKGKMTKRYVEEVKTWGINQAKWKAAEHYAENRLMKFQLITEDQLGIK
jgi:hypothetical protein